MNSTPSIIGYADRIDRSILNPVYQFQWQLENSDISGAISQDFTIDSISQTDSANYRCIVYFFGGSISTSQLHLKVDSPIIIVQ